MHATFEEIAADAMRLPPRDRVKLAQRLVSTLDPGVEKDVEGLWLVEAERRLEELRTGEAKGIDAPEAFRKAHEALNLQIARFAETSLVFATPATTMVTFMRGRGGHRV